MERFPSTRHSAIRDVRSPDSEARQRALATLAAAYWKPVVAYIRMKWPPEQHNAEDLAQGFFAATLEKNYFAGYDPDKARFRTWLRVCLDGYVSNQRKAAARLKRGGGVTAVELDDTVPEQQSLEEAFQQEWVRSMFSLAVDDLRALCDERGKQIHFRLFSRYDLEEGGREPDLGYQQLAAEFSLPVTQVTNYLAWARREFRRIVMDKLREITGSDEEFRQEARLLLGVELK